MGAQIVLAREPAAAGNLAHLPERLAPDGRLEPNLCADSGTFRNVAHQTEHDPVIGAAVVVIEKTSPVYEDVNVGTATGDKQIQAPVVIVVAPRGAVGANVAPAVGAD